MLPGAALPTVKNVSLCVGRTVYRPLEYTSTSKRSTHKPQFCQGAYALTSSIKNLHINVSKSQVVALNYIYIPWFLALLELTQLSTNPTFTDSLPLRYAGVCRVTTSPCEDAAIIIPRARRDMCGFRFLPSVSIRYDYRVKGHMDGAVCAEKSQPGSPQFTQCRIIHFIQDE